MTFKALIILKQCDYRVYLLMQKTLPHLINAVNTLENGGTKVISSDDN